MPYSTRITRANPGCFLFLIDQSGSMTDKMEGGSSKAHDVATILNRVLSELIIKCSREQGVRDYFDVGVIGYGGVGPRNGLGGTLTASILNPISSVEASPIRVEERTRKISDGAGGLVEVQTKFPVWFDAVADGGTPMCDAITLAARTLLDWCDNHSSSFPPVVLHLTDGESTDGNPEPIAQQLRQISTDDGQILMLNIHVSSVSSKTIVFPDSDQDLSDEYAKMLYRMSSLLVGNMLAAARSSGFEVNEESRAFMFNANTERVIEFFEIGTSTAENLR